MDWYLIGEILGVFILGACILSSQLKHMRNVLICQIAANVLSFLKYAMQGGISGAGVCIIAIVQTLLLYIFNVKKKNFPMWGTCLFIAAYTSIGVSMLISSKNAVEIIPIFASLTFALAVIQTRTSVNRIFSCGNCIAWIIYNVFLLSPSGILLYTVLLLITVVGIIRLDREDWKKFFTRKKKI